LAGPTAAEKQAGYVSSIPAGVRLNSIRVENGTAFADFSSELNQGGGSCLVTAIRAQIEKTLEQFSTVNKVEISVAGDTDDVLQP
jgi:spore germination protein GerM